VLIGDPDKQIIEFKNIPVRVLVIPGRWSRIGANKTDRFGPNGRTLMIQGDPRGLASLKEVMMSTLERVFHPVGFLSHLLHLSSPGPAFTSESSPDSVADFDVKRAPATDNPVAGMKPAELDQGGYTVYEPLLVLELMMDLP